ncbi:hypothetical protein UFOVP263_24 [uncultured Caudovirales phage]|uniref:Uncharacterized protein n=1 Tax=uncultured Caudovirales phage TaxID=2100421 RepID=A0A6J5TDL8_9CAUD|nr:hypothetical protein UFOVP263_24 [uncultured Caudovirales phage]CAB4242086.1 hypothetical protein UFOVP91_39 [uncultured Caudovirales phage]
METIKHTFQVGQEVSYGFNGDWYHAGKITKITKKLIHTERGMTFSLRIRTIWTKVSEYDWKDLPAEIFQSVGSVTWTLAHGIIEEQNPHF